MATSRRNNRALNRVLRDSLRARPRSEPPPQEEPSAPRAAAYTLCADIPECYNDSYVRAIPKDPQNTFVYWELPKDQAIGSLFADKGTAHVRNDEAVRIGEQLNENQRRRQADNSHRESNVYQQDNRQNDYHNVNTDYCQINWDDGNHYSFNDHNQPGDNGNHYNFDGGGRQHHPCADNYHRVNWDNGKYYCFNDRNRQQHHHQDDYNNVNWSDGEAVYQYLRRHQENICRINRNENGDYVPHRHSDDGSAFSEMLAALIDRCNRYIADYRQSGGATLARAISSGLLCGIGEEPQT